jgi:hypothetical protein
LPVFGGDGANVRLADEFGSAPGIERVNPDGVDAPVVGTPAGR